MEIKKHVIGYNNSFKLMFLTKEEYQLALCDIHVIRTTDDFNEAEEVYNGLKLVWNDVCNNKAIIKQYESNSQI